MPPPPSARPTRFAANLAGAVLRVPRAARDALDRALHARRRTAALERLRAGPAPESVLFVCEGNLYRSPFAAEMFARALPPGSRISVEVESAGFVAPGQPAPPEALDAAARRGVDLTEHRSTLVHAARAATAGLLVVMEPRQRRALMDRFGVPASRLLVLGDLDPGPIETRAITDPWGRDEATLEAAYDRLERCVGELARALAG